MYSIEFNVIVLIRTITLNCIIGSFNKVSLQCPWTLKMLEEHLYSYDKGSLYSYISRTFRLNFIILKVY